MHLPAPWSQSHTRKQLSRGYFSATISPQNYTAIIIRYHLHFPQMCFQSLSEVMRVAGGKIGGFLDKNQEESVSGREIRMDAKLADGSFLQDHVERQHRPLPLTSPSYILRHYLEKDKTPCAITETRNETRSETKQQLPSAKLPSRFTSIFFRCRAENAKVSGGQWSIRTIRYILRHFPHKWHRHHLPPQPSCAISILPLKDFIFID